jgi:hypothetical protein
MANTYTQLYTHVVFHTKSTGIVLRDEDLERVFQYIGGIIREEGAIPFAVGGVADHVHIFMTNVMHFVIDCAASCHPYGVSSEFWFRLSAGVPLHSTTCLSSGVPTGLGFIVNITEHE